MSKAEATSKNTVGLPSGAMVKASIPVQQLWVWSWSVGLVLVYGPDPGLWFDSWSVGLGPGGEVKTLHASQPKNQKRSNIVTNSIKT